MEALTKFRSMDESTPAEWAAIAKSVSGDNGAQADRVLAMLKSLEGSSLCMPIDPYAHCLQTATRAYKDGAAEEIVVCALLHDIGDLMAPQNHAEFAAAIVRPYVSDVAHGIVLLHEIFQGYHYFDKVGLDRNLRDKFRGHPAFAAAAEFCAKWDQAAFDAEYPSMPLAAFEPMLRRVLGRAPYEASSTERIDFLGFRINMAPGGAAS